MKNWTIKESSFQKEYLRKYGSIMCQGNGYMGIRAATEEDYRKNLRYGLVAGTFDWAEALNTNELPCFADVMGVSVIANGISMDLTEENTEGYERSLSLKNGLLKRRFIWTPREGLRLEFSSERFVALKELHVSAQRVNIKVLEGKTELELQSGINGENRYGEPHFIDTQGYFTDGIMQYAEKTHESEIIFVVSSAIEAWKNKEKTEMKILPGTEKVMASCSVILEEGDEICFEKLSRVATTRDKDINISVREELLDHEKEEMKILCKRGYEKVWGASEKAWEKVWQEKDVIISGDADYDQLAVRFAIYHLTIMAPLHDNRMNIGAKGLSGKGYFGHTFWDTEMYMLPFFTWTDPKGARSLLEYRYNCLEAARAEARDAGFEGAKIPWEAAWITDQDTCPKKHFTQLEIHSTADVAYGVYYYYEITHDVDFMCKYGCEIIFETAQYWKSRVDYNSEKDIYEICNVIGPDEFTHHADNNAYTNYLTHLNFQLAIQWKERLEKEFPEDYVRLNEKLDLESREVDWKERMDKLVLPVPNEDNILPQDSTYLTLPEIDISIYREGKKKLREDYPYPTYTRLKVSKQADVMNLFLLLEELFTDEVKRASLDYYEPYCVHESSLSLCAYSMLAADCGEDEKAYELFKGARDIDLSLKKDSDHGIHAASLGGIWQCCVLGFAGLRMCGGKMRIVPNLPKNWDSVSFRIWWRGTQMQVTVTKDKVEVKKLSEEYQNKTKILSYNVFYKEIEERKDNIFDVLLTRDADVMLLQEVSIPWIPRLKEFMKEHNFSYYGYGRHGGELFDEEMHEKEQFTPILWKTEKYHLVDKGHFFLSCTPEVYSTDWEDGTVSKFPRCVNWVILKDKETDGEFMALCIHTDPENPEVRTKSSELAVKMADKIRKGRPLVMGGDWNMQPEDPAYEALIKGGYLDVRFSAKKTTYIGSFNAWGKRTPDNFAFGDYLFTSDNMKAEYFEVVDDRYEGVHVSDHCPLESLLYY